MEIVKIQKKLVIRPLKNSYSKKTIYCFPRKLNGVKLLQQARSTFCLVYALQASQKSHGVAKKRRKTEKTEKKKKGWHTGIRTRGLRALHVSVANRSLSLLNSEKFFDSFSHAMKRTTLILAGILTLLLCNDP